MAAITDISDIANLLTDGTAQHAGYFIDNRIQAAAAVATIAGQYTSLWRYNKTNGGNGAIPGAAAVCDRTTLGALGQANASGAKTLWALGWEGAATQPGVMVLYDRLLHVGGLSGTVTTAQTVGGTLTRNTGGVGNEIWVEIYTAVGTTATTITASYTNQAGTTGRTTPAVVFGGTGAREESRMIRLPLADGDTGVQAVASVTHTTTSTAGSYGVTIAKPLCRGFIEAQGACFYRDFLGGTPALPEIVDDACLAMMWLASNTNAPRIETVLHMVEK